MISLVLAFVAGAGTAGAGAPTSLNGHPEFMPSDEVEIGMRITGKTCFQGTEIEEFEGVVIGVESHAMVGSSIIWAELEGPRFGPHGGISGMSGSPMYVGGRLIGALSLGFSFSQKPIIGITPIESMLPVLDLTSEKPHPHEDYWAKGQATVGIWDIDTLREMAASARPPGVGPFRLALDRLPEALRADAPAGVSSVEAMPLAMPLAISRCSPEVYRRLEQFMGDRGLTLLAGGFAGGPADGVVFPEMEEGSALGLALMTGDLTLGSLGTVTYRNGKRLIGFGHPAFGWGNVDIPMAPCSIFAVHPSYQSSFKLGQVGAPIGSIRQDREFGVGGVIGPIPRFIPMTVQVKAPEMGIERNYKFNVWDNRFFMPQLLAVGFLEAIATADRASGDNTISASYTIEVEDEAPIHKSMFYASAGSPGMFAVNSLFSDLALLTSNPFRTAKIESVDVELEVIGRALQAAIVSVHMDKEVYRPGETARLTVYLQPYRGAREKRVIEFPLGEALEDGIYELFVGDFVARMSIERERAPGLFTPMNYEQTLEAIRKHFVGNELFVVLSQFDKGLTIHGQELPMLPSNLRETMASSSERAFIRSTTGRFIAEQIVRGETEFIGSVRQPIVINRSGKR